MRRQGPGKAAGPRSESALDDQDRTPPGSGPLQRHRSQIMRDPCTSLRGPGLSIPTSGSVPPGLEYLPYQKAGISYAVQRKDTPSGMKPDWKKPWSTGIHQPDQPRNVLVVAPATLAFNMEAGSGKVARGFPTRSSCRAGARSSPGGKKLLVIPTTRSWWGDEERRGIRDRFREEPEADMGRRHLRRMPCPQKPQSKRSQAVLGEFGLITEIAQDPVPVRDTHRELPERDLDTGSHDLPGQVRRLVGLRQTLLRTTQGKNTTDAPPGSPTAPRSVRAAAATDEPHSWYAG